jgi:localization factor PodJL
MANKVAQSGRFSFGEVDLESEWQSLATDLSAPGSEEDEDLASSGASAGDIGEPDAENGRAAHAAASHAPAETQLYAYLEASKEAARIPQTTPFDDLAARLNGFYAPRSERTPPRLASGYHSAPKAFAGPAAPPAMDEASLTWFDEKFTELRSLIGSRDSEAREIASINERLTEIIERVDALAKSIPGEPVIQSIEAQLANLALTLDTMREAQKADAQSMTQAAGAVSSATERLEKSCDALETATGKALENVALAAEQHFSRGAKITAGEIGEALRRALPDRRAGGPAGDIRAPMARLAESGQNLADAAADAHIALRDYLSGSGGGEGAGRDALSPLALQPLKRLGVHMPITAGAPPAFTRSPKPLAAEGARASESNLKNLTARERGAREADHPVRAHYPGFAGSPRQRQHDPRQVSPVPTFLRRNAAHDDDYESEAPLSREPSLPETSKGVPLLGVGAVALILLLASAALLYLKLTASAMDPLPGHAAQKISAAPSPAGAEMADLRVRPSAARGDAPKAAFLTNAFAPYVSIPSGTFPTLLQATRVGEQSWDASVQLGEAGAAARPGQLAPDPEAAPAEDDLQRLADAASRGDSEAQYLIGRRLLADTSIRSNASSAVRWLTRAANRGHMLAQYLLGTLYEKGAGVARSDAQAAFWYRRAAEGGHVKSMHNLGVLYTGQGDLPTDYAKSVLWFTRAAERGLADSQFNLAMLYENGLGVAKDRRLAYFWFDIAGLAGDREAQAQADRLRKKLSEADLAKADAEIQAWRPQDATAALGAAQGGVKAPG